MRESVFIGLDLGSGGVRGCATDETEQIIATTDIAITKNSRDDPATVLAASKIVLKRLAKLVGGKGTAISVVGTSGSLLGLDCTGSPLGRISLYSDKCDVAYREMAQTVLSSSPSTGASANVVGRAATKLLCNRTSSLLFEATFVASALAGKPLAADLNNALKAGGDPNSKSWTDCLTDMGVSPNQLPPLVEPGTPQGQMCTHVASELGFFKAPEIVAGTTDGCASSLAAGLTEIGLAVTSLGTTLTLKILSDRQVTSEVHGIYSHRLLGNWLVGGASNAGGAILSELFTGEENERFSQSDIADAPSRIRYVPLTCSGERFPVVDPYLMPRLEPRPRDRESYFLGIVDSIVEWERRGYVALQAVGAPKIKRLTAVGGGTRNAAWMATRLRDLNLSTFTPISSQPAFGAARLAKLGLTER